VTRLFAIAAASGVLILAAAFLGVAAADASPKADARALNAGLARSVAAGRLTPQEAAAHRAVVRSARSAIARVGGNRRATLARVLHLVRLQAVRLSRPRALALFGMLRVNTSYIPRYGVPPSGKDVVDRDGVLYRAGWDAGLQFHPLGNVTRLNLLLIEERRSKALRLATALARRLVSRKSGAVLEYYFPYAGGSPPWTSGMAQAVAAQAFARTGRRLGAPRYFGPARRAYLAFPRLTRTIDVGTWVRHYSFSDMVVLNSQLQTSISLVNYGEIVHDPQAVGVGDRLEDAGRAALGRFDTGAWTNYTPGNEAPLKYHLFHVRLAQRLAGRTKLDAWVDAHARFDRYTHEAPRFRSGPAVATLYPWPADGFRDGAPIRFFLSKISTGVRVRAGGRTWLLGDLRRGWHSVTWRPGRRKAGVYTPLVSAVDLAGNRGRTFLRGIRIGVDRTAPVVTARVEGRVLHWTALDATTPWVRLRVRLVRDGVVRVLELGRRPLSGSLTLGLPRGSHQAVLAVFDSSGNRTRVPLGVIPAPAA
jgi:hypothetical protein